MFDPQISEDYYKPIIVNSAFNNDYIQYESKGDKILTIEEYLSMIESYLVDMINDHKNKGEWKIQLSAEISFISSNCFCAYTTENKLESHKKLCENHDYCCIEMPNEDNKILQYNHGEKSMRAPFTIYADLESSLEKMDTCHDNTEKSSSTAKINKYMPSGYSLFTHCSFNKAENKLNYYRDEDCMKKFCKDLTEHATKIINYEKKEIIPLTKKEEEKHNKQKVCYICRKEFNKDDNNKKYHKVKDHCHYTGKYRGAAHDICNLRYKTPKEIPVAFHNGSTYDYHFIIKNLAEEFEGEFECLGENTFSVPIKKEITKKDRS